MVIISMANLDTWDFILTVCLAMVAGVCIGIERQMKNKNAGLKTNALVAVGAAIFINISYTYIDVDNVDITRIISQVIVGVGFLGAGVIVQNKKHIEGLATAAAIWCSAGLGCLSALKLYYELLAATLIIVFINVVFGFLNEKIRKGVDGDEG